MAEPFALFVLEDILLISIQEDIDDRDISRLIDRSLVTAKEKSVVAVIIDMQNVDVVDSYLASNISHLAASLSAMEIGSLIVGLKVPAVMTLLDFGVSFEHTDFALDLEQALKKIGRCIEKKDSRPFLG